MYSLKTNNELLCFFEHCEEVSVYVKLSMFHLVMDKIMNIGIQIPQRTVEHTMQNSEYKEQRTTNQYLKKSLREKKG